MIHNDGFHNNAGFDLHARTTVDQFYSYIESAAFRVGETVVEIEQKQFYLDGVEHSYSELPISFGGESQYSMSIKEENRKKEIQVDLNDKSKVLFKFYKHYLTINMDTVHSDMGGAVGLLGEFPTGNMFDRDGLPMTDFEQMGFEWQVSPNDRKLFREDRSPQLPFEQCRMPTASRPARRNLRAKNQELFKQAQDACAHLSEGDNDLCLDDVMMTGDVGLAEHAW